MRKNSKALQESIYSPLIYRAPPLQHSENFKSYTPFQVYIQGFQSIFIKSTPAQGPTKYKVLYFQPRFNPSVFP